MIFNALMFNLDTHSKLNIMQVDFLQKKYSIKNNLKLNALEKPNELKNGSEMIFERKTQVLGTLY